MADRTYDKDTSNIPVLDNTNESEWNLWMMFHLRSKDLLDVCEKPLEAGSTPTTLNKYTKASHEAINIIVRCGYETLIKNQVLFLSSKFV
ncbi:hypothetical protein O181_080857 [Austropuccinia psidii MF-1]|uniref:Uncharacterized protein n=1 Tax=Austropuccinia psidii MF-1 TaxID=1389203 RepID=A0A9Q3FPM8_9BASI|nr:hypothetical protein [Austropuccinia psidii MF-1]